MRKDQVGLALKERCGMKGNKLIIILTLLITLLLIGCSEIETQGTDKMGDFEQSNFDTSGMKNEDYSKDELKQMLTPLQYWVTQEEGTEPPFRNEYYSNHEPGIYVDIVSGEPLFSSIDKYDSGTGWPSYTKPLEPDNIIETPSNVLWLDSIELKSKKAKSHLGHILWDGPNGTARYCINSASIRFIHKDDLVKEGFDEYVGLFGSKQ
jgi:methionine-R-sulfoxide reductase